MASIPINPTQITPPRVEFIDQRTGAISREWYRFLLSLLNATQTALDGTLVPDPDSLIASYSAMLDTLAQATGSQATGASVDDVAVLQTQIVDLELEPPCASVEDVSVLQTQTQDLAQSVPSDIQSYQAPVWSAVQDLALAPRAELGTIASRNTGATGSFLAGLATVTVVDGIITKIV
jgi:hypothetical protein